MQPIYKTTINSISEFAHQLETRVVDRYRITLFRGQSVDKALIPSIARHRFKKSREVDERRMFEEFISTSKPFIRIEPKSILEQMAIAQHHGVPTRTLDWTENALTALYFATEKDLADEESHAVVWVMSFERDSGILINDQSINPFEIKGVKFYRPANIIQRISSQSGWLSVHQYLGQGFFLRAEEINDTSIRINKILIPKDKVKHIRIALNTFGINNFSIFQDLDSLGRHIFRKYKS